MAQPFEELIGRLLSDLFDEGKEAIDEESKNESLTHFEESDELGHEIQVFFK
ncbi:hypothetical protein ZEAMMB73_Zm00001d048029 [Zea mays]|uniref:Uncharacterized protein n=1 Tax=Zea mays TaxID=4577 RepID=A0A1D6PFU4_MAIZE|nr:hypothetical protein ZEAMMB73_Zm00001d048029 [Zea mays]AQL08355.1 hypothetical protein ZEAMMB73_Zm00001d048029 [Zea mays]